MSDETEDTLQVGVGIKTHNPFEHLRMELVEETMRSVAEAFPSAYRIVYLNGCDDGSKDEQLELCKKYDHKPVVGGQRNGPSTPGDGAIHIADWLEGECDVIVMSDDDMRWRPGAEEALVEVWTHAPSDLLVVSGLLEPVWPWNTPRQTISCGRRNVLSRDSCPGAAWSFRQSRWSQLSELVPRSFGYDTKTCDELVAAGYRVGQIDLAEHIGEDASTHENRPTDDLRTKPLDRERWGV